MAIRSRLNYIEQKVLVKLSKEFKSNNGDGFNVQNKDIAKYLGVTDVYVARILSSLEDKKIIARNKKRGEGRRIFVLKPEYNIK